MTAPRSRATSFHETLGHLAAEDEVWFRLAAVHTAAGAWEAHLLELTSGAAPPRWLERTWDYPIGLFVGGRSDGASVVTGRSWRSFDDPLPRRGVPREMYERRCTVPVVADDVDVLERVIEHYLTSGDFNGLFLAADNLSDAEIGEIAALVQDGLLQVVGDEDYLNPHIRPWASKRSIEEQVDDVASLGTGRTFCLYPTPRSMEGRIELARFDSEPYRRRLAGGDGTLELAYFVVDVVENYRNDPRYHYWSGDVEVHFGIGNEAYADPDEAERDKIASLRVGFAYDSATIRSEAVRRFACAFLGDLADLTPEHQQRWRTYEVEPSEDTEPHPLWWAMQMGHWPDGIGPFQRILDELDAISELFEIAHGVRLFRSSERPREWGWVLRPSMNEWNQFIHASDKLLSENIQKQALDAVNARTEHDDGTAAGTLARLGFYLADSTPCPPHLVDRILGPLKRVRKERQKPAHALVVAGTDATITAQQRDLLGELGDALRLLREILQQHPATRDRPAPDHLDGRLYVV